MISSRGEKISTEDYVRRLKERQAEIERGENTGYANSPELLSLVSDDMSLLDQR